MFDWNKGAVGRMWLSRACKTSVWQQVLMMAFASVLAAFAFTAVKLRLMPGYHCYDLVEKLVTQDHTAKHWTTEDTWRRYLGLIDQGAAASLFCAI